MKIKKKNVFKEGYCKCGCGQKIIRKPYCSKNYTPQYIVAHNLWWNVGKPSPILGKHWKLSKDVRERINKSYNKFGNTNGFKKGQKAWNSGKKLSKKHKEHVSEGLKRYYRRKKSSLK